MRVHCISLTSLRCNQSPYLEFLQSSRLPIFEVVKDICWSPMTISSSYRKEQDVSCMPVPSSPGCSHIPVFRSCLALATVCHPLVIPTCSCGTRLILIAMRFLIYTQGCIRVGEEGGEEEGGGGEAGIPPRIFKVDILILLKNVVLLSSHFAYCTYIF